MNRTEKCDKRLRPRSRPGLLGRFARDTKGATAIEFAMLAIPFCLLIFAILESCISFAAQQVMANVTDDVAREIRTTGKIKLANGTTTPITPASLKTRVCRDMKFVAGANCESNIVLDLREFDTFAEAAAIKLKFKDGDIDTTDFDIDPGGSMTKNMLRVFYRWPVMTDLLRLQMSNLNGVDGYRTLHFATQTWKNEPFDD